MKKELKASIAIVVSLAACLCLFLLLYVWLGDGIEIVEQGYVKAHMGKPGYVLLDVREARIFNGASPLIEGVPGGHIPGAVNLPLSRIASADWDKSAALFVYCLRGSRSLRAVATLRSMGYADVRSIGGITAYRGELAR